MFSDAVLYFSIFSFFTIECRLYMRLMLRFSVKQYHGVVSSMNYSHEHLQICLSSLKYEDYIHRIGFKSKCIFYHSWNTLILLMNQMFIVMCLR